ncbi:Ppx/GppA phosphatase family protein [Rhizobium halophilum]|uniref:Ppx/GppA phosphatase family protein n=1 Tax=Rhizobium halophilum TaxID=2846852 RepID=UPI001EFC8988|nr:Ppx/GppA phosphatase family protein [Rhizobium halophilum]MCF6369722.1 Ppx/GppA family phosphatase [Rhizobium halophilum]
MMDPDSGGEPPEGGASAAGRGDGRSSRRRKAKRRGKIAGAAPSMHGEAAQGAALAGRPQSSETGKRKRRRAHSAPSVKEQGEQAVASSLQDSEGTSSSGLGDATKLHKRRKKARGGRGLQGRPLVHARPQPAFDAKAVAVVSSALPHDSGAHISPDTKPVYRDDFYAALDLGTNNCRLLIAQPTRPGQFRVVDAFSRIVRLGEGLAANGRLSEGAMDRAVEALRVCASKLANRPIRRMRLIATEACRSAENGQLFLDRVVRETGLTLEIIDRETEARLAVSGCSSLVGREARSVVLFDIGGGSSEIAVIRIAESRSSRLANHITHWTSLPVGVVTLSERHGGRDVTPQVFEAMVTEVAGMLARFDCPPVVARQVNADDFHLIGTSGTVTTLAGVHLDLPRYDRRKVDGLWLSDAEVTAMQAKLLSWGFEDRAANPCIGPDRADLVLAGCAILEAIRRRWPSPRMRVADRGLREGILTDMMADDGAWRRIRPRRPNAERHDQGGRR